MKGGWQGLCEAPCHPKNKTQLPYNLADSSLSTYAGKTKSGKWVFPDYSVSCPICEAANCAVRYAFYYRGAIDINGLVLILCIARYRCRRKGKVSAGADRTFSLLPSSLAPYQGFEIGLMGRLLSFWLLKRKSISQVLDYASAVLGNSCDPWLIDPPVLYRIKSLWNFSVAKLNQAFSFRMKFHEDPVELTGFLAKGEHYASVQKNFPSGFSGLELDYYYHNGGWVDNAHFLFGTASQHRRSG